MREIKFRGKRVDNGEWVYGDLIHRYSNWIYIAPIPSTIITPVIEYTQGNIRSLEEVFEIKTKAGKRITRISA